MAKIVSKLNQPMTFACFFGPLTLNPGLNEAVDNRQWKLCKNNNADLQLLLKKEMVVEVEVSE